MRYLALALAVGVLSAGVTYELTRPAARPLVIRKLIRPLRPGLTPQAMLVRYYGVRWHCRLTQTLSLLTARTPASSAAAVWIGAQRPDATQWVQAGIFQAEGQVYAYAESKSQFERSYRIKVIPWRLAAGIRAQLQHRGHLWRAGVDGLWTPWRHFAGVIRCVVLELQGLAHATASINGRVVTR